MTDRLTAMRVFVSIAESGSFSATAVRLELSRAMVTRHVATLEQWLGARLLQRTTRSVTLTDTGETCLRRSRQMLALADEVEQETSHHGPALRGQLRVTCSISLAYAQMAAALADFLALHPQLKIDLNASEGALNLVEARIDLAIRISAEPDPALIGRVLAPCSPATWPGRTWPTAACRWCCPSGNHRRWRSMRSTLRASTCRRRCARCWTFRPSVLPRRAGNGHAHRHSRLGVLRRTALR